MRNLFVDMIFVKYEVWDALVFGVFFFFLIEGLSTKRYSKGFGLSGPPKGFEQYFNGFYEDV